jgi:hypothetical protein
MRGQLDDPDAAVRRGTIEFFTKIITLGGLHFTLTASLFVYL